MLFDAVFNADSEYHVYFAEKPNFDNQNLEIPRYTSVVFQHLVNDFEKIDFLGNGAKFFETHARFFTPTLDGWNDV